MIKSTCHEAKDTCPVDVLGSPEATFRVYQLPN
jgi:hypothetical protein